MTEKSEAPPKVFVSYSWEPEHPKHKERVLRLANTLRNPWGIETDIDQYVRAKPPFTPWQGWDIWMEKKIEWADFVLIVCTETYKRRFQGNEEPGVGRGVTWEGTIIRQNLYNEQLRDTKFIPVVFSAGDLAYVPLILNGHDMISMSWKTKTVFTICVIASEISRGSSCRKWRGANCQNLLNQSFSRPSRNRLTRPQLF